jgi:predicted NACHT family NTPase
MDLLAMSGISTNTVGFLYKTLLEKLMRENLDNFVVKLFSTNDAQIADSTQDTLIQACIASLTQFLLLVQQELEDADESETKVIQYTDSLDQFIRHPAVLAELGKPFQNAEQFPDSHQLAQTWETLHLLPLPDEFDWKQLAKRYRRKALALGQESLALQNLLTAPKGAVALEETADISWLRYRDAIKNNYGYLRLDTVETSGYSYQLQLWNIFVAQDVREVGEAMPQIHELPKSYQQRLIDSDQLDPEDILPENWERYKKVYAESAPRSVLELVEDKQNYPYLVILGDPGSGKSSLVQYLALQWAEQPVPNLTSQPIPLLIELRKYMQDCNSKQCRDFLDFFHQASNSICNIERELLQARLVSGGAFVIFDGLDEVFDPQQREQAVGEIVNFTLQYPRVRVLVTSRVIGYKPQRLREANFRHFMLQDLTDSQIDDFLKKWHELAFNHQKERQQKQERLHRAIAESQAIRELTGNPLLLTMMAILNRYQELPRDRAELYNQCSRVLLQQWDLEKALKDERVDIVIDYKDKQAMLRRVAAQMQADAKGLAGNLIAAEGLEAIITDYLTVIKIERSPEIAELIVEQLRTRNFILCFLGADYYAFVHRTFLEYFCATDFVWQFEKQRKIDIEYLKTEVFGKHWRDESWHEVLRLIAGSINERFTGEIIEYLMTQNGEAEKFSNLFLAAKCLDEVRNRNTIDGIASQLLVRMKKLIRYSSTVKIFTSLSFERDIAHNQLVEEIRTKAVAAFAATWKDDPETLPILKQLAQSDDNGNVRRAAVQELARGWKDDPETLPWLKQLAQSDDDWSVRRAAVQELARGWKDDPETLPWLKQLAQSDDDWPVRGAAVQEIPRGWKDDPETLPILKQLAQSDDDSGVRRAAVQELARGWKDDPETLPILKQLAQSDDNGNVRGAAVQELAWGWKDDPETLPILKQLAQSDDDSDVRRAAVQELARGWKDNPETLPGLKQLAQSDDDWLVRRAAVQELAGGWKDDPEILPWLKQLAQSDDNGNVRRAAVQELARGWKDDPETLPWLKQLAQSDDDSDVRYAAVQELAGGWKDDPETLPWLKQLAQSDDDSDVRRAAVQELTQGWKDDPEILPILKQLAQSDDDWHLRQAAVEKLTQGWKDDPETLPILKQFAQSDDNGHLRQAAVQELARGWKDDPETLPILKQLAQSDDNGNVRRAAVQELARGWKDDPETLPILKQLAQSDDDSDVRQAAVQRLARGWKDDPETLPILKQLAQSDDDSDVRQAAVQRLARGWKDDPELFELLCDVAINDPFARKYSSQNNPRQTALAAIIELYPDRPQTLEIVRDRAQNDSDERLRKFAQKKLAKLERQ